LELNQKILRIAIPSIVSNITVPLLGLADVAVTGHMGDARYMAAVAVGSMMFNLIYWLFGFLRMGTSGLTSQALGARQLDETVMLLLRSVAVATFIALAFIILQWPLRETLLRLMSPPDDVRIAAATYFGICIWGAPAVLSLYGINGWLIGMQDTRTPMVVAIVQNVINIAASVTFVFVFRMEIRGVALGTLSAQWLGLVLALVMIARNYGKLFRRHLQKIDTTTLFNRHKMSQFFQINRDLFLRTCLLVCVNLFFTAIGSRQGAIILSVNSMLMQFYLLFSYFMDGFANAGEALAGRYFGARNYEKLSKTVHNLFVWGIIVTVTFTGVYLLLGHEIITLLTDDRQVIAASLPYLFWTVLIPCAGMAAFVWDGLFIGQTRTKGMLIGCAVATMAFFATFFGCGVIHLLPQNHALWLSMIVFLAVRGAVQTLLYKFKVT